eukprot:718129-Amphidinium_carterae.2
MAAASQEVEVVTFTNGSQTTDGSVVRSMQQMKQQTRDQSTQYTNTPDREIDTTRVREGSDRSQVAAATVHKVPSLRLDEGLHYYEIKLQEKK